jgi:hypothetical protein
MLRPILKIVVPSLLLTQAAWSIKIDLRYDYDTAGFFNQPGAKNALRLAADYFESMIKDSLQPIDHTQWPAGNTWSASFFHPATGNTTSIANLKVPADTIVIFAGARSLGTPAGQGGFGGYSYSYNQQGWANAVTSRGQTGALATPATDFGPWGGAITFNTTVTWNFSPSTPVNGATPFVTIALHELGHALGIGTAPSWLAKVSGGSFTGARAKQAYGGNVPLQSGGSHWKDDGNCAFPDGYVPGATNNVLSKAYGIFGAPHGFSQIAIMDPSTCTAGTFHKVITDLDIAGLRDIGWQIDPPVAWVNAEVDPDAGPLSFSWPSSSGFTYRIQKSTSLATGNWTDIHSVAGNGLIQTYNAAAPADPKAFYRLNTTPPGAPAMVVEPPTLPLPTSSPPVMVGDCHCGASWACD